MLSNFIGGGQIFLHKLRMFLQVLDRSFMVSLLLAMLAVGITLYYRLAAYDWQAASSYQKALLAAGFDATMGNIRQQVEPQKKRYVTKIAAYSKQGLYADDIEPHKLLGNWQFKQAYQNVSEFLWQSLLLLIGVFVAIFLTIFLLWAKFGKLAKASKQISGSRIKTASQVATYLRSRGKASDLTIGGMPLVKDSETRHLLVTGTTGAGKTNLLNTLIPQIRNKKQPAVVVDQTGEMIARYYSPERGDIIFNPLDSRSHSWDFWADATSVNVAGIDSRLEKFAKVLFRFGKKPNSGADPFWDNSAEIVFISCAQALIQADNKSLPELQKMLQQLPLSELAKRLQHTKAARYLAGDNKVTASSILSVVTTSTKPLNLLFESEQRFSLRQYFNEVKNGSDAWLFLATPPDQREVVLPLIACLLELGISYLIGAGINERRRVWFILDELAALGRVNALTTLMSESRKYGGCVLAATQSVNQLFDNFGHYAGSSIFGQFATKFIFRNDEPSMAKIISEIFGHQEYTVQQKNTSYGAHEHRDGVSYTEQEKRKALISTDDVATLANLECYVGLPEPEVRIAKIKMPPVNNAPELHQGFIPHDEINDLPSQKQSSASLLFDSAVGQPRDLALNGLELNLDLTEFDCDLRQVEAMEASAAKEVKNNLEAKAAKAQELNL